MTEYLVKTQQRQYPIYFQQDATALSTVLAKHINSKQVMIVSNKVVAKHYLSELTEALSDYDVSSVILPDGESFKTLETLTTIFDALIEKNCKRDTTLIALGGGVIGDMTGFAASCYQRGVPFIQYPTTLLAQVDSSIGGKTAVNYQDKKNFIGAFYQPQCVFINTSTLNTLPEREFVSGLAEVIKHAAIADATFFTWLENNMPAILQKQPDVLIDMLTQSAHIKANIVAKDETEQNGTRALLNFGHTFAHAIESATHYKTYLHGEAVAIGMIMAAEKSKTECNLTDSDFNRLKTLCEQAGLPITLKDAIDPNTLTHLMSYDKKHRTHEQRFILLNTLGDAVVKSVKN